MIRQEKIAEYLKNLDNKRKYAFTESHPAQAEASPRQLPIVEYKGVKYYVDYRLEQVRNVNNPHDFHSFESSLGSQVVARQASRRSDKRVSIYLANNRTTSIS